MNQQTLKTLYELKLTGMSRAYENALHTNKNDALTADELVKLLVQSEWEERHHQKLVRLTRSAKFRYQASVEEITFPAKRNLDKNLFLRLADCSFIDRKENILITGATGVGKSFLASALGHQACSKGHKTSYYNIQKLFTKIAMAKADGSYVKELGRIEKKDLLIIDDFGLQSLDAQRRLELNGQFIGFMGIGVNITDRKRAEAALEESERQFRTLADSINQLAWIANGDGWIFWYNHRWYNYTGTNFEEMQGWGWKEVHHPNHINRVVEFVKSAWEKGEPWELEFPLRRHDGIYRWFLTRAVPIKNSEGIVIRWFGTNTDIEDQKTAIENLAKAKEQLQIINFELSTKNEELGKINNDLDNFIYTASHDLKAPISNIEGLISALPETVSEETNGREEFHQIMQMVKHSINRFKNTIQDLTDISRVQRNISADKTNVDICEIIDDVKISLNQEIENSHALINIDLDHCPSIYYSKKNFKSIVYNLISNSLKYRSPERQPLINLKTIRTEDYIILSVEDNGLGVEPAKIDQMFGMFKRLHDHVEGTGIGLYIVKRIVENNGGKIEVESEVGKGTTFKVYFKDLDSKKK